MPVLTSQLLGGPLRIAIQPASPQVPHGLPQLSRFLCGQTGLIDLV